MTVAEIVKHIEEVAENKAGQASSRSESIAAQQMLATWEIALQLAKLNERAREGN